MVLIIQAAAAAAAGISGSTQGQWFLGVIKSPSDPAGLLEAPEGQQRSALLCLPPEEVQAQPRKAGLVDPVAGLEGLVPMHTAAETENLVVAAAEATQVKGVEETAESAAHMAAAEAVVAEWD